MQLTIDEAEAISACIQQASQRRVDDAVIAIGRQPVDLDALYEKWQAMEVT